jgi:two-component system NtrC family sensor kinase
VVRSRVAALALVRGAAVAAAAVAVYLVDGARLTGLHADLLRYFALFLVAGVVLPRAVHLLTLVPLLLLAGDLVALGAIGTFLAVPNAAVGAAVAGPSMPFLAGLLVAVLVAVTGRRLGAGALGALAGAMIVVLGASLAAPHASPESENLLIAVHVGLVAAAALESAVVTGWIHEDLRRKHAAVAVDREIRSRDSLASEMATFAGSAAAAESLAEMGEAIVQHLRRHVPTRARAVVLEAYGQRVAIWEEAGRLDDDQVERRRLRLQAALRDAGSSTVVDRLDARSTSSRALPESHVFATAIGVPIHVGGRVDGVIFVADPRRSALPEDRIGALAELSRRTGEGVQRLERRRHEHARRTSLLLGQMREGVLLLDAEARVVLSNPAGRDALKALGRDLDEPVVLGEATAAELAAVPPGATRRLVVNAPSADGLDVHMSVAATGVVDGGHRLGTLVTLTDVTEEERARRRLLQAEKLSVVGQTLAGVAHELNNPLAAIVGYADLLQEETVSPDVERLLGRIREQSTRASRIVRNLLNVVRRRGPERTQVGLNEVAQSVADLFAYDARLSNVEVALRLDPELPPVSADRHAVQQVLVNLVQNAVHALRASAKGKARGGGRVEIRTHQDKGAVLVTVQDDGPGVPVESRQKIFEAFFTTKGPEEGTGLGLAIARGIAREHGGELLLEPSPVGAAFTLRLPCATGALCPAIRGPLPDVPDGVPPHVLVVDDEAPVRDSLAAQLARLGSRVDAAGTPLEATRLLSGSPAYDAVLLDVRLPGTTGIDLHRALRARNPGLASKVVFMTGDVVNDDVLEELKRTGNAVLEKPFTFEELRTALNRAAATRE